MCWKRQAREEADLWASRQPLAGEVPANKETTILEIGKETFLCCILPYQHHQEIAGTSF